MRRALAERAVSESTLTMSERTVMMMLLRRSNNEDCAIPVWNTPTIAWLATEIPVTERRLRRILAHLVKHGWLEYTPGTPGRQPVRQAGKGKGRFLLLPGPPEQCRPPCEGVHNPRKRGFQNPDKKGVSANGAVQVTTAIPPRVLAVTREEGEGTWHELTKNLWD